MTKMTLYTKGTFKIVENPAIVEKFLLTEQSAIERFYCTSIFYPLYCLDGILDRVKLDKHLGPLT